MTVAIGIIVGLVYLNQVGVLCMCVAPTHPPACLLALRILLFKCAGHVPRTEYTLERRKQRWLPSRGLSRSLPTFPPPLSPSLPSLASPPLPPPSFRAGRPGPLWLGGDSVPCAEHHGNDLHAHGGWVGGWVANTGRAWFGAGLAVLPALPTRTRQA